MCTDLAQNKTRRAGSLFQTWPDWRILYYLITIPPAWVAPSLISMLLMFSHLKREPHGPPRYLLIRVYLLLLYVLINRMSQVILCLSHCQLFCRLFSILLSLTPDLTFPLTMDAKTPPKQSTVNIIKATTMLFIKKGY
jgi:hypothetical protein